MQINIQEAAEISVEKEKVDPSEELQATKSQVQRPGKERKKAVKSTEKFQDTTNKSKSTRSKLTDRKTDNETSEKDEIHKTKQKAEAAAEKPTKAGKTARGPQRKVEEKESNQKVSEPAAKGRRKLPGTAQNTTSSTKNQSKVKTEGAPSHSRQKAADVGAEEAHSAGLRRSKRIANRR